MAIFRVSRSVMAGVAFVDAKGVTVRVQDERHSADRRLEWIHVEPDTAGAQVLDGDVEILDFQRDGTATGRGIPVRGTRADR